MLLMIRNLRLISNRLIRLVRINPPLVTATRLNIRMNINSITARLKDRVRNARNRSISAITNSNTRDNKSTLCRTNISVKTLTNNSISARTNTTRRRHTLGLTLNSNNARARASTIRRRVNIRIKITANSGTRIDSLPTLFLRINRRNLFRQVTNRINTGGRVFILGDFRKVGPFFPGGFNDFVVTRADSTIGTLFSYFTSCLPG